MPYVIPYVSDGFVCSGNSEGDGGFAGGENLEVVLKACHGEDAFDGFRGGGETKGYPSLPQGVFGAHEGREGCGVHKRNVAQVQDDSTYTLILDGPLYSVLDPRGGMEIHLTPHGDNGVSLGMVGYAGLEVRACSLLS